MKVLLIDNFDSFTYILKDYIEQCGAKCEVIRNNHISLIQCANEADALVISPGPSTPAETGQLYQVLKLCYTKKPMLGVCLGHQAIGTFFGAELVKAHKPMHGKTDEIHHHQHPLFLSIPNTFRATRYHSLILQKLPPELVCIATSSNNEIMAIAHKSLPLMGIQFHPESCMTEMGLIMLKNFLSVC